MRRVVLGSLLSFAALAAGDDLPRSTPEGARALEELTRACVASGGLVVAHRPASGRDYHAPGKADKLAATVAARRQTLTPALRETLVRAVADAGRSERAGPLALLEAVAAASGDDRTRGFASLYRAIADRGARRRTAALAGFAEAAARFEAAGEPGWQTTALNERGSLLANGGDPAAGAAEHRKALAV